MKDDVFASIADDYKKGTLLLLDSIADESGYTGVTEKK